MGKKRKKMRLQSRRSSSLLVRWSLRKRRSPSLRLTIYIEKVRVENVVTDERGDKAGLKPGAEVDVIVEADSNATMKKP
jgi:hypothetical protein